MDNNNNEQPNTTIDTTATQIATKQDADIYTNQKVIQRRYRKLSPEIIQDIYKYAKQGLHKSHIAALVGISTTILYDWINKGTAGIEPYVDVTDALQKARAEYVADRLAHAHKSIQARDSWEGDMRLLESVEPTIYYREGKRPDNDNVTRALDAIVSLVQLIDKPQSQPTITIEATDTIDKTNAIDGETV